MRGWRRPLGLSAPIVCRDVARLSKQDCTVPSSPSLEPRSGGPRFRVVPCRGGQREGRDVEDVSASFPHLSRRRAGLRSRRTVRSLAQRSVDRPTPLPVSVLSTTREGGRAGGAISAARRAGRTSRLVPGGYLVDPASSHMLVSKIKPCMCKYTPRNGETANGSLNRS